MGREPALLLTYPTRLATANSRFLQSRLRSCSRSLHATLPGKSSYVPGSIHSGALGKGSPCAQGCALPKSSCQVHLGRCAQVATAACEQPRMGPCTLPTVSATSQEELRVFISNYKSTLLVFTALPLPAAGFLLPN